MAIVLFIAKTIQIFKLFWSLLRCNFISFRCFISLTKVGVKVSRLKRVPWQPQSSVLTARFASLRRRLLRERRFPQTTRDSRRLSRLYDARPPSIWGFLNFIFRGVRAHPEPPRSVSFSRPYTTPADQPVDAILCVIHTAT